MSSQLFFREKYTLDSYNNVVRCIQQYLQEAKRTLMR